MGANYQRKKYADVLLPQDVYMQVRYKIKGYERLMREKISILYESSPQPDGMPRGNKIGNETESKALRRVYIDEQLEAIDQTRVKMMGDMSEKVQEGFDPLKAYWNYDYFNYRHIRTGEHDNGPSRRTWNRFKDVFSFEVAKKLNIF